MEARATDKKLTRRERLDKCKVLDIEIPKKFKDQGLTFDIMDEAGEVDGVIYDLAAVKKWQLAKVAEIRKKDPPPSDEEVHQISQLNAFTTMPFKTYKFLKELDQEIEAWLVKKEIAYKLEEEAIRKEEEEACFFLDRIQLERKKREEEKAKAIQQIETEITQTNEKINYLLDPQCTLSEAQKEHDMAELLYKMDILNKSKSKSLYGLKYYDQPEELHYEIAKLEKKKEYAELVDKEIRERYFSKEEQEELDLCYRQLDSPTRGKIPGITYYRPGLLQLIGFHAISGADRAFDPAQDLPLLRLPRLNRRTEEKF